MRRDNMLNITLYVYRRETIDPITWTEDPTQARLEQKQRAKLIHSLVDALDLEVTQWGDTDDSEPHEVVEIIIALGSAGVFTAMVSIIKIWVEKEKIKNLTLKIEIPGKPIIQLNAAGITESQVQSILTTVKDKLY
jgi:hypothetical protein